MLMKTATSIIIMVVFLNLPLSFIYFTPNFYILSSFKSAVKKMQKLENLNEINGKIRLGLYQDYELLNYLNEVISI